MNDPAYLFRKRHVGIAEPLLSSSLTALASELCGQLHRKRRAFQIAQLCHDTTWIGMKLHGASSTRAHMPNMR